MTGETGGDDRLAGLFHAAASDVGAPPPRFDHGDVVATSRRITARRRSAVVGGAVALLVVAGVGTVATLPRGQSATVSAAAPAAPAERNAAGAPGGPAAAPQAAVGGAAAGAGSDSAGSGGAGGGDGAGGAGAGTGSGAEADGGAAGAGGSNDGTGSGAGVGAQPGAGQAAPLGPGRTTCADRQDPALRALLVQALPEAAGARAAATTDVCLPGSQRYVSLELGGGVLTVGYLPPGTISRLAPGASSAPTASGGTVIIVSPPALHDRAPALLASLAPHL